MISLKGQVEFTKLLMKHEAALNKDREKEKLVEKAADEETRPDAALAVTKARKPRQIDLNGEQEGEADGGDGDDDDDDADKEEGEDAKKAKVDEAVALREAKKERQRKQEKLAELELKGPFALTKRVIGRNLGCRLVGHVGFTAHQGTWKDTVPVAIKFMDKPEDVDLALLYRDVDDFASMLGIVSSKGWIVMEYGDLTVPQAMQGGPGQPPRWQDIEFVLLTLECVVDAMKALSAAGGLYGDLKLENLLYFKQDNSVKLCDFSHDDDEKFNGLFEAAHGYMAPELLHGREIGSITPPPVLIPVAPTICVTAATDVWSYGCVVWEMLQWHLSGKRMTPLQWYRSQSTEIEALCTAKARHFDFGYIIGEWILQHGGGPRFPDGALGEQGLQLFWDLTGRQCLSIEPALRPSWGLLQTWFSKTPWDDAAFNVQLCVTTVGRLRRMARTLEVGRVASTKPLSSLQIMWPDMVWEDAKVRKLLHTTDLKEALSSRCVWIQGAAGVGKSALCRFLVCGWGVGEGLLADESCIIYISVGDAMREVCKRGGVSSEDLSLETILHWYWKSSRVPEPYTMTPKEIRDFLKVHGHPLYIFDGVDQGMRIAEAQGDAQAIKWLKQLASGELRKLRRVLLSGRPEDTLHFTGTRVEMCGLVNPLAYLQGPLAGNDDIIYAMKNPNVIGLVKNPLNFQLICKVYQGLDTPAAQALEPPDTLTDLYEIVCVKLLRRALAGCGRDDGHLHEALMDQFEQVHVQTIVRGFGSDNVLRTAVLCCGLFKEMSTVNVPVEGSTLALGEWEQHEWDWWHSSFEDFFAARRLVRAVRGGVPNLEPLVRNTFLQWQFSLGMIRPREVLTRLWMIMFSHLYDQNTRQLFRLKEFKEWKHYGQVCELTNVNPANLLEWPTLDDKVAAIATVGNATRHLESPAAARKLFENLLYLVDHRGVKDPLIFEAVMLWSGLCFFDLNILPAALQCYERGKASVERRNGMTDDILGSYVHNIGLVYEAQDDLDLAMKLYKDALKTKERNGRKETLAYANILHSAARIYRMSNNLTKALELFQEALDIKERVVGAESKDYAVTLNSFAFTHHEQGDWKRALELYQQSLAIDERIIGKNHQDYATTLHNIANVYRDHIDVDKALDMYQEALDIYLKTFGSDNDNYREGLNGIAKVYQKQGDWKNALRNHQAALKLYKTDNQYRKDCISNLTACLKAAPIARIVSDGLIDFVRAKLDWKIELSDRELVMCYRTGKLSLIRRVQALHGAPNSECLRAAARNPSLRVRKTLFGSLKVQTTTEALLLAMSCNNDEAVKSLLAAKVPVTQECVAFAKEIDHKAWVQQLEAAQKQFEQLAKSSFLDTTVVVKKSGNAGKNNKKKGKK